jgi:sugar lactone lactonase YvrE
MTDYAAAPVQPIAQCLYDPATNTILDGNGFSQGVVHASAGSFLFTFDIGVPGAVALDPNKARTFVTTRGDTTGFSNIDDVGVSYPQKNQVLIGTAEAGTATDPSAPLEIIVYRGGPGT